MSSSSRASSDRAKAREQNLSAPLDESALLDLDALARWLDKQLPGDGETENGRLVRRAILSVRSAQARVEPGKIARTAEAMADYPLNPGHSDLDDEQPMFVKVGDGFVACTLGDIRRAQLRRTMLQNVWMEFGYVACERGDNIQMMFRKARGLA